MLPATRSGNAGRPNDQLPTGRAESRHRCASSATNHAAAATTFTPLADDPSPNDAPIVIPDPDERAAAEQPAASTWVEPVDGACPSGYPVKGNANSGIYHVPGGRFYDRTVPERCYATAADAEADGYRAAKS